MSYAAAQYKNVRINTSSPLQVLIALYDGAIRFLRQADTAYTSGNSGVRGAALNRAHAIIAELQATLDPSQSAQLCAELDRIYDFVLYQIQQANIKPAAKQLEPAVSVLLTLRSAWAELAKSEAA